MGVNALPTAALLMMSSMNMMGAGGLRLFTAGTMMTAMAALVTIQLTSIPPAFVSSPLQGWLTLPALLTTFTFGKYRGKSVAEVADKDPGYLRWLYNNLERMSPELRLTLKHYLGES
jgi:hypothetical protein